MEYSYLGVLGLYALGVVMLFLIIPLLFGMLVASIVGAVGVFYYWVVCGVVLLSLLLMGLFYYFI